MPRTYLETLKEIANLPTAPFMEGCVADYITGFVAQRPQLRVKADRFGNLLVKYTPRSVSKVRPKGRPILFAAHMDHPGFIAGKMVDANHLQAEWHGGVQSRYFKNTRIRFYAAGRWIPATIEKVLPQKRKKGDIRAAGDVPPEAVIARVKAAVPPGSLGMWNIPDAVIRGNRFFARVTDDLSGLAAIICMLDDLCRNKAECPCYAFFTRAEEVGFVGALAAVDGKTIPQKTIIVAVENSSVIPGVTMGAGPILRVGDKSSVFTPAATAYCQIVADKLAGKDKSFRYQRKLMDGGSCESTAYCQYGYDATCICLPLVNYHNMDRTRRKIAPESVDVRDYLNLVKWFIALAKSPAKLRYDDRNPELGKKLDALLRQHRQRLLETGGRNTAIRQ